ncbi:MAG: hypothetical protein IKC33_04280 [Clostridia bacterium]|nr:hypothetical protein [Clostridia bacterium]
MEFKSEKTTPLLKLFCLVIAFTLVIFMTGREKAYGYMVTGKTPAVIDTYFDTFFAYSGVNVDRNIIVLIDANEILASDLLSDADKAIFEKEHKAKQKSTKRRNGPLEYEIFLGVKDGKDIVYIQSANINSGLKLVYESNLPFTFDSVIKEFERLSGTTLTQEFLQDCERHLVLNQPGGITVYLVPNAEKTKYNLVFWSLINNQIYITSPEYIKAGVLY